MHVPKPTGVDDSEVEDMPHCPKGDQLMDIQRRLRSLLIEALRTWRLRRFDCLAIEHVLQYVQDKISKFEESVGEIQGAAAGKAWAEIKQAVDQLLQRAVDGHSIPEARGSKRVLLRSKNVGIVNGRLERQSGVQGISWSPNALWTLSWQEAGIRHRQCFPIKGFVKQGLGEEEAVEAALRQAKDYREELVRQGKAQPSRPKRKGSLVRGVAYEESSDSWRVQLWDPYARKLFNGGRFEKQGAAEDKARELAEKFGRPAERKVVPVQKISELPRFAPLGSQKGIIWRVKEQCWSADGKFQGVRRTMRFRPRDGSEAEVKKAWTEAVAWYREQDDQKSQPYYQARRLAAV